ncbi:MAG: hypothetical protein PHO66_05910 [Eubacteriales bacterium]|nr:hypothetical protein [Eubacteriales bacterium]
MLNYDYRRIRDISAQGITYLDEQGQPVFLSFEACRRAWAENARQCWRGDSAQVNWSLSRCVGESISAASPMYYQFYGQPQIRFTFDARRSWWRRVFAVPPATILAFRRMGNRIEQAGWSVFHIA